MTDWVIPFLERLAAYMGTWWGPLYVFVFMTIESSLIPFPSEVVMLPAGFWAARGEFFPGGTAAGLAVAFAAGLAGCMAGAYFNYYLALWVGRPFLHKYGKYVMLSPQNLDRTEEIFREYGEVTTFVCRMLPAIRQLISLPAGLSKMRLGTFSLWTALGAGFWNLVLMTIGYHLGKRTTEMSYADIVHQGKQTVSDNMLWVFLGCAAIVVGYVWVHKKIMSAKKAA